MPRFKEAPSKIDVKVIFKYIALYVLKMWRSSNLYVMVVSLKDRYVVNRMLPFALIASSNLLATVE